MGGDKDLIRWLRDYENRRLNPDARSTSRLNWRSSKYDLENMSWQEVQDIWLPELDCTWGFSCNYLRKQWFRYKMEKREGERGWEVEGFPYYHLSEILKTRKFWLSNKILILCSNVGTMKFA